MTDPNPAGKKTAKKLSWTLLAVLAAAILIAALLVLGGCSGDRKGERPDTPARDGEPEVAQGGTAILAELGDMSKPMPLIFDSSLDGDLQDVMYMGLTRAAYEDGRLVYQTASENPMALAWLYEFTGRDSTALRYRMRSGLRWSDGEPITADDVVWTYRTVGDERLASPRQDYVEHLDSVVAENDSTVVFHFDRRYPEMLFHSGLPIAPKHVYSRYNLAELRSSPPLTDPAEHLVVSGPFRVGRWEKGQRITLVPNPYFTPKPNLDAIVIRVIPEETTRLTELQTGGVDFMRPVSFDKISALERAGGIGFQQEQKRFYDYIAYNPKTVGAFADPEIRRALGLAIDVPGILRALQMDEYTTPAAGPYSPIFKDLYDPEQLPPLRQDTAQAKKILASKGWSDTDGDGIRDKNGKPLRFTLLTNAGNQRRADVSQIVQQQWRRIGVDARLQSLETNTFFDRLYGKKYEAALAGWAVALSPDLTGIWGEESPLNVVSYEDSVGQRLMQQALAQPTEKQAAPLWRAAAQRIVQDQPYTFLYYMDQVDAVRDRLKGMRIDTYGAYQNAWEWWIPKEQQRPGRGPAAAVRTASPESASAAR